MRLSHEEVTLVYEMEAASGVWGFELISRVNVTMFIYVFCCMLEKDFMFLSNRGIKYDARVQTFDIPIEKFIDKMAVLRGDYW